MTILFAYDGSESADAAIAAAGQLLGDVDATADVVTVWEPLTVEALRAARFGGSPPIPPDVADVDRRAAAQAKRLASAAGLPNLPGPHSAVNRTWNYSLGGRYVCRRRPRDRGQQRAWNACQSNVREEPLERLAFTMTRVMNLEDGCGGV